MKFCEHGNESPSLTHNDRGLQTNGLQLEPVFLQVGQAAEAMVNRLKERPCFLQEEGAPGFGHRGIQYGGCLVQVDANLEEKRELVTKQLRKKVVFVSPSSHPSPHISSFLSFPYPSTLFPPPFPSIPL